jgi:hypothetical protein
MAWYDDSSRRPGSSSLTCALRPFKKADRALLVPSTSIGSTQDPRRYTEIQARVVRRPRDRLIAVRCIDRFGGRQL